MTAPALLKAVLLLAIVFVSHSTTAQVANNQIDQRLHLTVDAEPVSSTTAYSSVEWKCINKALTNKCLVYHNDQWFSFHVNSSGDYYINISQQECSRKLGTQLILIEGNPCETKTYRIVKCLSKLPLEDTFVKMDSLKAGVTYLINVDGFLGDACRFDIQVSLQPKGVPLPIKTTDAIESQLTVKQQAVKVTWLIEEERAPALKEFVVMRSEKKEPKAVEVNRQPLKRNAYGAHQLRYELNDTLPREGVYTYKIYGAQQEDDALILLTTEYARYIREQQQVKTQAERELIINLNFAEGTPFKVIVFDAVTSEPLMKHEQVFEAATDKVFKIDVGPFIDNGKREFMVLLSDFSAQGSKELFYKLNDKGKIVRQ